MSVLFYFVWWNKFIEVFVFRQTWGCLWWTPSFLATLCSNSLPAVFYLLLSFNRSESWLHSISEWVLVTFYCNSNRQTGNQSSWRKWSITRNWGMSRHPTPCGTESSFERSSQQTRRNYSTSKRGFLSENLLVWIILPVTTTKFGYRLGKLLGLWRNW